MYLLHVKIWTPFITALTTVGKGYTMNRLHDWLRLHGLTFHIEVRKDICLLGITWTASKDEIEVVIRTTLVLRIPMVLCGNREGNLLKAILTGSSVVSKESSKRNGFFLLGLHTKRVLEDHYGRNRIGLGTSAETWLIRRYIN